MDDVVALADEYMDLMFDVNPLMPALLGINPERSGLEDLGEEAEQRQWRALTDIVTRAKAIDPARLTAESRTTRDVLVAAAQARLESLDAKTVEFCVSDGFQAPATGLLMLLPMTPVATAGQAAAQLDRLRAVSDHLDAAAERHRIGIDAGRRPVARGVRNAIAHIDRYLADPDGDPLRRQEAPADAPDFDAERTRILEESVRPAFRRYRDVLESEILPRGRPDEESGVCHVPGGDTIYRSLARVHTTTDRTADDLHETGLRLIGELAEEYREVGGRVFGTDDLREIFRRLRTDEQLRWNNGDELLEASREAVARAERATPEWFGTIPPESCVVEAVPETDAPGAAPAYYLSPATDGSRPGMYFANTYKAEERFRHTVEATAFHEAVPGHHFQISRALGLTDLPLMRRLGDFNAYTEGWGLYAERLAHEMGLYSGDVTLLGMLSNDSMRAGRLVVDTGLHAKGWSRQQAIDYLIENTPMAEVEIVSEVDRYINWPGQALAYMVGRLEIERVRAKAEEALGASFDIRAFHDVVLGGGAMPLSVLDGVVSAWAGVTEAAAS
ncbi:Uncharacterized conserved protein, DUF885 familyt [Prauserella aidingensis]|uniref:DUF885 domain-containing protein n=1 Tax=Prauserella aidingensis TaxID=387890 RepID=UPI0020A575C1|nr:DUF885 domain-containing protein [Prauserella aidingensis]MCP2253424.1 Uncharacterized conserved protein, DUF885 familyt [Prauserella aidingensis]